MEQGYGVRQGWIRLSDLALALVLTAAVIGAVSLARQKPAVPPLLPPPAWAVVGHDSARTAHALAPPFALPVTLRWRGIAAVARPPVIDGYNTVYLSRADGALLSIAANGDRHWCAAVQPITDTACTGPQFLTPPPPLAPAALVGVDTRLYVAGDGGMLLSYDRSSPIPLWRRYTGFIAEAGLASSPDGSALYGIISGPRHLTYEIKAVTWRGRPVVLYPPPHWHGTPIPARAPMPISVAPDGTLLVAARSPAPGRNGTLYAFAADGTMRWHVPLVPGPLSLVSIAGTGRDWVAWIAVQGQHRSFVFVVDPAGHVLWRWSTGHLLTVDGGGVALAHPQRAHPRQTARGYVGSSVGVYALDLGAHKGWLFYDTRRSAAGVTGPPITDAYDTVYVGTSGGHVYDIRPDGRVRWRYDTGRDARYALAMDVQGTVIVTTRDPAGTVIVEALGEGGMPLAAATGIACADPDCPTPTPTPTLLATATPSPTIMPTATPTIPMTPTPSSTTTTLPSTITPTPSTTPALSPTVTPTPSPTVLPATLSTTTASPQPSAIATIAR